MEAPAQRCLNDIFNKGISTTFQRHFNDVTEVNRVLQRVRVGVDRHDVAATRARDHDASESNAAAAEYSN